MSLFPAYAPGASLAAVASPTAPSPPAAPPSAEDADYERALLEDEPPAPAAPVPAPAAAPADYYEDTRRDRANLRVSTLYRPARPDYTAARQALGRRQAAARRRARARRYWHARLADPPPADDDAALRDALAAAPDDERLLLLRIEREGERAGADAALRAAEAAARACPAGARVRAALLDARRRALPLDEALAALAREARAEREPARRRELWARLIDETPFARAQDAAEAALAHTAADPLAYAHLLLAFGRKLRAAGHSERLVQLVELTATMNGARLEPPPAAAADEADAALVAAEERARAGRLPPHALWVRVERLRAAAHWRPGPPEPADPERAGDAAAAAALVRAARPPRLAVALLRLCGVPLLPASEALAAAGGRLRPPPAEALAALLRASRRLPPAHPARPASAAEARATLALALDPPHCYSDSHGYLAWVGALWDACCEWVSGERRLALVAWRLRWLHSLAALEPAEARRLRAEARALVRRHAPRDPLAYALAARLEPAPAGARAAAAAARAARAAPPAHRLFAARALAELAGPAAPAARWALCCAVAGRPLPPDDELREPPPPALVEEARRAVAERCAELERDARAGPAPDDLEPLAAMLPGAGEWAAARVALASPAERARMLASALAEAANGAEPASAAELEYREREAVALVASARGAERARAARELLARYPGNAALALESAGGAWGARGARDRAPWGLGAWGGALPALLAWGGGGAGGAARAARALGAGALRLEAAGRAGGARGALPAALAAAPDALWTYARGAAWEGAQAAALQEAALERGLRVRVLLDELRALDAR